MINIMVQVYHNSYLLLKYSNTLLYSQIIMSNKRPRSGKKLLNELWNELNPTPVIPLLEVVQDNVYNRIEVAMRRKERKCIIPVN